MSFKHTLFLTDEIDAQLEGEINEVFTSSFSQLLPSTSYFSWKYRNNPFGSSYHLLTYDGETLIGSRVFWRIGPIIDDFQCVDTCVLSSYRGRGIFKETTQFALNNIPGFFYNAPNDQSYPQYMKYGWHQVSKLQPKFYRFKNLINNLQILDLDEAFVSWRYCQHPYFKYRKIFHEGFTYLFRLKKGIPVLIGKLNYEIDLPEIKIPVGVLLVVSYDVFPGVGICFAGVTNMISNRDVYRQIDPHWMDML